MSVAFNLIFTSFIVGELKGTRESFFDIIDCYGMTEV